jgi:CheY-like chemotaxis protein
MFTSKNVHYADYFGKGLGPGPHAIALPRDVRADTHWCDVRSPDASARTQSASPTGPSLRANAGDPPAPCMEEHGRSPAAEIPAQGEAGWPPLWSWTTILIPVDPWSGCSRAEHAVRAAAHGQAAQETMGAMTMDLVTTDVYMPETGGIELIRGAVRTLPQPFEMAALLDPVAEVLAA